MQEHSEGSKSCPSLLVRSVFCGAESSPCFFFFCYNHIFGHRHIKMYSSDIAIAYLLREIRSDHCFVPGFDIVNLSLL